MGEEPALRRRYQLRAGWTRVMLGFLGLVPGTLLLPELGHQRGLLALYLALALVQQALIWRDIGGEPRAFMGGVLDIVILSVLVHELGSVSTLICSLYVVLGII